MSWIAWLAGFGVALLPGAYFVNTSKLKVVRVYLAACTALGLAWLFGLGGLFGEAYMDVPKLLLTMLAPATLLLTIWATQRDRERVMGSARDRDAIATAAVLYGAGQHGDSGGDAGNMGGGDV